MERGTSAGMGGNKASKEARS
uniref:Uncharacterized protein n=1 Tax=Arundo donax TaxID=35708 RepID=A0A0A9HRE3_ARUDO